MAATVGSFVEYELSSDLTNRNVSIYHVKLTDSSLKSIEDFVKFRSGSVKPSIKFNGQSGVISIPDGATLQSASKTFEFSLSAISNDPNGSTECVRQDLNNGFNKCVFLQLGSLTHKLTVHAKDDVYQTTKEKMTLVEEESKKSCAKEIKSSDPKGKRIIKKTIVKRPQSLGLENKTSHKLENNVASIISVTKQTSSHVPSTSEFSLKERIIHLLALRPYKRAELLARLMRDGLKDDEKNSIDRILAQVAHSGLREGEAYTLAKQMYSSVHSNWPFYSDADRQLLKRRIQETSLTKAPPPAVSPVHSNHGSPMSALGQKRMTDAINIENAKKQRTTANLSLVNECNSIKQANGYVEPKLTETLVNINQQLNLGATNNAKQMTTKDGLSLPGLSLSLPVDVCNENDIGCGDKDDIPDYLQNYTNIIDDNQRQQYKKDFQSIYSEYMRLHADISMVAQKFKLLKRELQETQEGSAEYAAVKNKILQEYRRMKADEKYTSHRKRFHYLHAKLNHIKQLITDYDKSTISLCS